MAQPLDPREPHLPEDMRDILYKGMCSWLKNTEVRDMLLHYTEFNLRVAREPPCQPPGMEQLWHGWRCFKHTSSGVAHPNQTYMDVPALTSILSLTGGSLFLFDRKAVRFFRKDKHSWRKKSDGKTVRETHEKLKVVLAAYDIYPPNHQYHMQ